MGITLGSNFDLQTALPLDSRLVVADLTARDAISALIRYEGMIVYVTSEATNFQLIGGILDANWAELSGGGGGIISVADLTARDAIDPADRTEGMFVYVLAEEKTYQLVGGIDDTDWQQIVGVGNPATPSDSVGRIEMSVRLHTDPPTGTFFCNGSVRNAIDYPELAEKLWDTTTLKYKYGGTGTFPTGTFRVPDFRGRFLRGTDTGAGQDLGRAFRDSFSGTGNTGDNIGSNQASAFESHTHQIAYPATISVPYVGGGAASGVWSGGYVTDVTGSSGGGGGGGSETRPINVTVNYFIRYEADDVPPRGSIVYSGVGDPNLLTLDPVPLEGDTFIEDDGDLWVYDDADTWNVNGVNLMGPMGLQGGITTVADLTARDAIPTGDRYEGMLVYVESEESNFQLIGGIDNADWKGLAGGALDVSQADQILSTSDTIAILPVARQRVRVSSTGGEAIVDLPSGTIDGQEVVVTGLSSTNFVTIEESATVATNGAKSFYRYHSATYVWDNAELTWIRSEGW